MEKFVRVNPEYTGGGIYVFTGELANGNYFMADTSFYDVRVLDADPNLPLEESEEDAWASVEWQEEHLVEDLEPKRAKAFFIAMLKWVMNHEPSGNYLVGDMDYFLDDVKSLKGNWR